MNFAPAKVTHTTKIAKALPSWLRRSEWRRLQFGEFAESINERVEPTDAAEEIYVGLDDLDPGSLHIRRWGTGSDVIGTKLRFRKGEIIFGRRRAYQRKLALADVDGICSAHAMVVPANPQVVLAEFLPFLMMSDKFMNRAVEISVGSLSPTINWTTLKFEEFDLPPLDQQRRISEILWAVDGLIAQNLRALEDSTKCLEASFQPQMGDWPLVKLEEFVAKFIDYRGKTPKKNRRHSPDYSQERPGGSPLGRAPRIHRARRMRRGIPSASDLLFTTEAPLGNVARVPSYRFALAQRTICLSPDLNKVDPSFLFWGLQSTPVQDRIRSIASGTTVLGIKQSNLRKLYFPLPEMKTQIEAATLCDLLANVMRSFEKCGKDLEAVRSSLIESLCG